MPHLWNGLKAVPIHTPHSFTFRRISASGTADAEISISVKNTSI
ncbi:hypothetical protein [Skermanella aerolata]|nr:hypothetical protein [Skermanella aerolata]KJB96184.1 hypothetical protein N826_38330 [Skermanella aerolata KACC 11604]